MQKLRLAKAASMESCASTADMCLSTSELEASHGGHRRIRHLLHRGRPCPTAVYFERTTWQSEMNGWTVEPVYCHLVGRSRERESGQLGSEAH